jgi:hypothetical protein
MLQLLALLLLLGLRLSLLNQCWAQQFPTKPTTGMTAGELFVYDAANVRQIAVAQNDGTTWYVAMSNN